MNGVSNTIELVESREAALAIAERLAPFSRMSLRALYATLVEHLDAEAEPGEVPDLADDCVTCDAVAASSAA